MLVSVITLSALIPAYAEVTSLKTNLPFYKGGSSIYFSGTVLNTDPSHSPVTVLIFDPNNKFITLASGITDSNNTFQIVFDTSTPNTQQSMSLKGIYNATAFIANKTDGKTVSFVFSPDGSPMVPSSPTSMTSSIRSTTEIDLSWAVPSNTGGSTISGYKIERNDGNGFVVIQNTVTTNYQDTGLAPNKQYSYRVSAINSAGTSDPSGVISASTLSAPPQATLPIPPPTASNTPQTNSGSSQSLSDILQQRYEAARKLQALLNAQTPGTSNPSSSPSTPSQHVQQTAHLSESVGLGDAVANMTSQKSTSIPQNNVTPPSLTNFDIKNIVYPAISLVGVGIVVMILYFRKERKLQSDTTMKQESQPQMEAASGEKDDDYAMAILKNRLAKGEITIDEFKTLKDELSEP